MVSSYKNQRTVVLFTAGFPFCRGGEEGFIGPEIEPLAQTFNRVILVPGRKLEKTAIDLKSFSNVEVDTTWLTCPKSGRVALAVRTLASTWFWRGVLTADWRSLNMGFAGVLDYFRIVRGLVAFRGWFGRFVRAHGLSFDSTLFYSFWFDAEATALGLLSAENKSIKVVTRVNGFDMFEFRAYPLVQLRKLRAHVMNGLLRIYPASDCGTEYLHALYPAARQKIMTDYLGVRDLPPKREGSCEEAFRILSISNVIALKRVDLVFRCLSALARTFPEKEFAWTHVGGGEQFEALKKQVSDSRPANLSVKLHGAISNEDVRCLLARKSFDLGVHLSESEGGAPLAVLEMLGAGLPVVACDAGGVRECVNDDDGVLLPIEIDIDSFAKEVRPLVEDSKLRERKADAAAVLVAAKFRASDCRQRWAKKLVEVLRGENRTAGRI